MAPLRYLTIQDILWINLQVTKKVHLFDYAHLEEAVFYQYAYGESNTLFPQAARFVSGFGKMHPFDEGNEATALVAFLAFLKINGCKITAKEGDLATWFQAAKSSCDATQIEHIATADDHAHQPDIRTAVRRILDRFGELASTLAVPAAA